MDIMFCMQSINEAISYFKEMRDSQFVHVWQKTESYSDVDWSEPRHKEVGLQMFLFHRKIRSQR
jgi:hypothetical protein